jgi:hypothetical protein
MMPAQRAAPAMAGLAVVTLPAEIDIANAGRVGEYLRAAFAPGVRTVIADVPGTRFCDTSATRWCRPMTRPSRTAPSCGWCHPHGSCKSSPSWALTAGWRSIRACTKLCPTEAAKA